MSKGGHRYFFRMDLFVSLSGIPPISVETEHLLLMLSYIIYPTHSFGPRETSRLIHSLSTLTNNAIG
jgi:hypothetical protein